MKNNPTQLASFLAPILKPLLWLMSRGRLPQTHSSQEIKGLQKPVEILWDRWHVPHIYAHSVTDAVFAQGFVHAQERLWQMDFNRRVIAGRLAEVLGEPALGTDRAMRTLGMRRVAEEEARLVGENLNQTLQAYSAGVNAWIETAIQKRKLPLEFSLLAYQPEPWTPADTLGYVKLMDWILEGNWASEFMRGQIVQRLGPEKAAALEVQAEKTWAAILDVAPAGFDPTRDFLGPQAGDGLGSNNWVVHGARTRSGMPLLANDMHLHLTAPAIWFENHLVGGELEAAGITFPGTPLIIGGHNRHIAWGFTDALTDVQDLYEEHLRQNPTGGWEYEYKGEWLPAQTRGEEIRIKGGKSVTEEVIITCHGPIVNVLFKEAFPDAPPLALRSTALEPETTFQAIYELNFARNCAEAHEALRSFTGPAQNVVYADTQGNIGYTLPGKTPIRAQGKGLAPAPGWDGEHEWIGYVPFEHLPRLENPPCGFIATANNPHSRQELPYFIGDDYCRADRATRIVELLTAQEKVDIPYFKQMHFDQVSVSARKLAACLGALEAPDEDLQAIVQQMKTWDGNLAADSYLAAVYQVTIRRSIYLILTAHLGDLGIQVQGKGPASGMWSDRAIEWFIHLLAEPASPWFDLGNGEQRDDVLRLALRQALDFLQQAKTPSANASLTWGDLHRLTFEHILGSQALLKSLFSPGAFPIGGDASTIWAAGTSNHDLATEHMVGPAFRFIADLGDLDHCWGVLAPGQSGHPASPHYRDGIQPWLKGDYHPMLFRRDEVEANLEGRFELKGKDKPPGAA